MYDKVLMDRVWQSPKRGIGEKQCSSWKFRNCSIQVFILGQLCEKKN